MIGSIIDQLFANALTPLPPSPPLDGPFLPCWGHHQGLSNMRRCEQECTVKVIRTRLKGKEGRLRGNLMGKRVDFSGRSRCPQEYSYELDKLHHTTSRTCKSLLYRKSIRSSTSSSGSADLLQALGCIFVAPPPIPNDISKINTNDDDDDGFQCGCYRFGVTSSADLLQALGCIFVAPPIPNDISKISTNDDVVLLLRTTTTTLILNLTITSPSSHHFSFFAPLSSPSFSTSPSQSTTSCPTWINSSPQSNFKTGSTSNNFNSSKFS
ncbi:hypothetical protein K435DRAFT_878886 [Dendrothele bispora CBS 962.96]|uniref:Uncharacterized protein n=1 Tax=Dendrothele bispora (strain CBS 962.96) TaxID=1314807 RepID=A0A4S8KN41_DENBC|nr:hypothetical protein K435DRAFT_878886 [Dendrothele bispora CBS 962.96]